MDRYECRKAIVKDLEEQGYLVKTEPIPTMSALATAATTTWSPDLRQWFVKMEPLAKEAIGW